VVLCETKNEELTQLVPRSGRVSQRYHRVSQRNHLRLSAESAKSAGKINEIHFPLISQIYADIKSNLLNLIESFVGFLYIAESYQGD
jgi:hypothetical protein